jgi:LacI family transcriptional regulator
VAYISHIHVSDNADRQNDPFLSAAVDVIESRLRENGYYLMLRSVNTPDELLSFLQNWNVDGLFLTGVFEDAFFEALSASSVPTVLIDGDACRNHVYRIGSENFRGSYLAASHLIENGHRRIAFASPCIRDGGSLQERFLGFQAALTDHAIPFDETLLLECAADSPSSCQEAADAIAARRDITALATATDPLAIGIINGLSCRGIRVPDDISVVGFDDIPMSQMITPSLTTVHYDMHQKAQLAADCMLQLLEGKIPEPSSFTLPVHLMQRESVRSLSA